MYAQLGDIVFEALIGFDTYQRTLGVTLTEQPLMHSKPRLGFTGINLQELQIGIAFHADFCTPENEIASLVNAMSGGIVLPLIFGNGVYVADFVIAEISEQLQQTDKDGNYIYVRLSVTLKEYYVADKQTDAQKQAQTNAKGLSENNPNVVRGIPKTYQTPQGLITTSTVFASSEGIATAGMVKKAGILPALMDYFSGGIGTSLANISSAAGTIQNVLSGNISLTNLAPLLNTKAASVINAAHNLNSMMPITTLNFSTIVNAGDTLQGAIGQMKIASSSINIFNVTRR